MCSKRIVYLLIMILLSLTHSAYAQEDLCNELCALSDSLGQKEAENYEKTQLDKLRLLVDQGQSLCADSVINLAYYRLAEWHFISGDIKPAMKLAKKSISSDTTSALQKNINLGAFNLLGNAYSSLTHNAEALRQYQLAKALAKKIKPKAYSSILVNEASVLINMGEFGQALESLVEVQKIFKEQGFLHGEAIVLNNLGELYRESFNEPEKALKFYKEAQKINESTGDKLNLAKNLLNLALAYSQINKPDSAAIYLEAGAALYRETGNITGLIKAYYNMGDVGIQREDYTHAQAYFKQAIELSDKISFEIGSFYGYLGLGALYAKQRKHEKAQQYFDRAKTYKPSTFDVELDRIFFRNAFQNLKYLGRYKEALLLHEDFDRRSDSINKHQDETALLDLRASYEADLAEQENARLKAEQEKANSLLTSEKNQKSLYLVLSLLSAIVLALALFLLWQRQRSYNRLRYLSEELKEKNEKLARAEKKLSAESAMKTRILSVMGHDLRAPFASIAGLLKLIDDDMLSLDEARQITKQLSLQVEQALNNLSNMLAWSRLQLNEEGIIKEEFELCALMNEVVSVIIHAAKAKDLRVQVNCEGSVLMYADENQIRSILGNLLNNAIKFSERGGLIVVEHIIGKDFHLISVKDEGVGLSKEAMESLNMGVSFTSKGTAGERGTGIGLSLVRDFALLHGGSLSFHPNQPKGTTVEVKLPVHKQATPVLEK